MANESGNGFATALRMCRAKANLTQAELTDVLNVSLDQLSGREPLVVA